MSGEKPNSQYNLAAPDSLSQRIAARQRREMYRRFVEDCGLTAKDSILDVGVTSDQSYASSNYLELWYPEKSAITAAGIDDASFLTAMFPGMTFVRADGLTLPFASGSFDAVHASAVLEHVGSVERQAAFIAECARVSRRAVFLTTPNRWFPMEVHTGLPLLHWLPAPLFRRLLKQMGLGFFADEPHLNLMSAGTLKRAADTVPDFDFTVSGVKLGGLASNLLLIGRRKGS